MEIICSGPRLRVYFDISERSHQELLKSLADASLPWEEVGISGTRGPFHHRWERAPVSHRSSRRPPRGSRRCRPEAGRAPAASVPPPLSAAPGLAQPAPAADFGRSRRAPRCRRPRRSLPPGAAAVRGDGALPVHAWAVRGRAVAWAAAAAGRGQVGWRGAGGRCERACGSAAAGAGRPWVGSGAAAERRWPPHSSGGGGSPGPAIKREGAGRRALRVCWSALRRHLQKRAWEGGSRRKSGRLCRATSCRPPAGIPGGRCGGTRTRGSPWLRGGGGKEAGSSAAEEDSPTPPHPAAPAGGVRSPASAGEWAASALRSGGGGAGPSGLAVTPCSRHHPGGRHLARGSVCVAGVRGVAVRGFVRLWGGGLGGFCGIEGWPLRGPVRSGVQACRTVGCRGGGCPWTPLVGRRPAYTWAAAAGQGGWRGPRGGR